MVDKEQELGRVEQEIPHQRPGDRTGEPTRPSFGLTDEEILTFFPAGDYEFNRISLDVTGNGVEEIGIHNTGERVEVYQLGLGKDGKQTALRGVLTGYHGAFGRGDERGSITINVVGILVGDEMGTELYTEIPRFDMKKYAQAVADKNIPISIATNRRTGETTLNSRTPAGLLTDIGRLEEAVGIFSFRDRRSLRRARSVALHLKNNFKSERPPDQPGRVKVKGQ